MMGSDTHHTRPFHEGGQDWPTRREASQTLQGKVEELLRDMKRFGLTPEEILKVAINFEAHIAQHLHHSPADSNHAGLHYLLDEMVEKNQDQLALIREVLDRLLVENTLPEARQGDRPPNPADHPVPALEV